MDDRNRQLGASTTAPTIAQPCTECRGFNVPALVRGDELITETGAIRFVPENWSKTYYEWMRNIYGDEINLSGGKRSLWGSGSPRDAGQRNGTILHPPKPRTAPASASPAQISPARERDSSITSTVSMALI